SSLFRAPFDFGKGAWPGSPVHGRDGPGSVADSSTGPGRCRWKIRGNACTETEIAFWTETRRDRGRSGSGDTDAREEKAITFTGYLTKAKFLADRRELIASRYSVRGL